MGKIKKNILKEMAESKMTITKLSKLTGINKLKLFIMLRTGIIKLRLTTTLIICKALKITISSVID